MKFLSQLICNARGIVPKPSDIIGRCVFCGTYTEAGYPAKLKTNFTGYSYLQAGEVICPYCYELYNNEQYRKNMWFVTEHEFKFFKRTEAKQILLNDLEVPFAIYLTKTWKKQGWIRLMDKVNYSLDTFFVGFDYDVILVKRKKLNKYLSLLSELLAKKIPKSELVTGELKPKSLEKIDMNKNLLAHIKLFSGDKLWSLCLYIL